MGDDMGDDNMKPRRASATADDWVEDVPPKKTHSVVAAYRSYTPEHAAEIERRLVRKVDLRVLPFLVVIYICNYLDRNSITQARLYGLQDDTGVQGTLYNTAISIFSAGYIVMQLPSPLLMTMARPSIFLVSHGITTPHGLSTYANVFAIRSPLS